MSIYFSTPPLNVTLMPTYYKQAPFPVGVVTTSTLPDETRLERVMRCFTSCCLKEVPPPDLAPTREEKMAAQKKITWERNHRIIEDPKLIEEKLKKQFDRCQNQAVNEREDLYFKCLPAPEDSGITTESTKISNYQVGVSHYIGRRPQMEDEHLATSFGLEAGKKFYPVQLFGVFDGHGGNKTSQYVKENLQNCLSAQLRKFCSTGLTDCGIWNALKMTFVQLDDHFSEDESGSTVTVAMCLDGKLWTANVGDSRTILDNGIQLSEDAKPADPRYKKGIEYRGGRLFFDRINDYLAVARAIGDHCEHAIGINPRPKITVYPLSEIPKGTHLILTCDGIYEAASTHQVAALIRGHKNPSAAKLAEDLVYSAYSAGSQDNLTAMTIKL